MGMQWLANDDPAGAKYLLFSIYPVVKWELPGAYHGGIHVPYQLASREFPLR